MMKNYIESLKFYNETEDTEDENNVKAINEEEIREKLEKLNELKKYMNNKYNINDSNSENEEGGIEDVEDEDENEGEFDYGGEELNYMEFLKAKEKERFDLYEKTMNNNLNDLDDDLNDIYNSEDDEEIFNIISNQLRQGNLNGDEKKYMSQLLKNRRPHESLGSDNSDFENYDYESSNGYNSIE